MGRGKFLSGITVFVCFALLSSCSNKKPNDDVSSSQASDTPIIATDSISNNATATTNVESTTPREKEDNGKIEKDKKSWFTAIIEGVYDNKVTSVERLAEPFELYGQQVAMYEVKCDDGKSCSIATISDGTAYINEAGEEKNFRKIVIDDEQIVISDSIDNDIDEDALAARAEEISKGLELDSKLLMTDIGSGVVDHRKVRIFSFHKKNKLENPEALIAIDSSDLENCYYQEKDEENYKALLIDGDKFETGDEVSTGIALPEEKDVQSDEMQSTDADNDGADKNKSNEADEADNDDDDKNKSNESDEADNDDADKAESDEAD